ncbi:MAG: UDP-N-acetylmuramate--L-alanine ligase [Candidatus Levybacteria bacterium]|nr:UDP-N-acetylmuramate--L-alanine ligase [Candidatus Levybacteria bacterium]
MIKKIRYIHFAGVKGVGMAPLAIIAKEAGINVTGSDIEDEFITDELLEKANIKPFVGFSKKNIKDPDLVITTGAHGGFDNLEVKEAKRKKIRVMTQGEAVGLFMDGTIFGRRFTGISVTGTHGKTTTTAMVATILKEANLDPSYVVGTGFVPSLGSSGHLGQGKYFVSEADEYITEPKYDRKIKFMWQNPKIAVITNIEFDHPDAYKTIDDVKEAFKKFPSKLPKDGILITCGDDHEVRKLFKAYKGNRITYGFSKDNDFTVSEVRPCNDGKKYKGILEFRVMRKNQDFGKFYLNVFGIHNALNATAAFVVGHNLGLNTHSIKKGLLAFQGTKRRSEFIGALKSGARVFDDYAHHPTEIKNTLRGFKQNFSNIKLVCIFQPHTYSRTKSLFEQFSKSFTDADILILTNIFASLREKKDPEMSSELLANEARKYNKEVYFKPALSDVVKYVNSKKYGKDTIIITMGAGDVYKISEGLRLH